MGVSQEMVVSRNPATSSSPPSVCSFNSLCGDCRLREHLEGGWRVEAGRQTGCYIPVPRAVVCKVIRQEMNGTVGKFVCMETVR